MSVVPPLDERYLEWLYSKIAAGRNRNPARSYRKLCLRLYETPFHWFVPNDDNRVEDARLLRHDYLGYGNPTIQDQLWLDLDASVLEVLIALAERCAFESDEVVVVWFRRFLKHLSLDHITDDVYTARKHAKEIDARTSDLIDRHYSPEGRGGLFPLKNAREDQRNVELWYQMSAYLLENHLA